MDRPLSRDLKPALIIAAAAAALLAFGVQGMPGQWKAALYAAGVGIALFLFARELLGDGAALAAGLLFTVAAAIFWPGPVDLRRGSMVVASILFFLAADRAPRTHPNPGLLLGGWLFFGASVLPNGIAGSLVVPAVLIGHLLTRPAEARKRFLRTPVHLLGIAVAGGALAGFLAMAREGTAVEVFARLRGTTVPPPVNLLRMPVMLLPFLPLAAASLIWAWRRARKDEAPFARTGLAWVVAALVVGGVCLWQETPASLLPILVPLAVLASAWLEFSAERNPLGSAARWGVGGACVLAVFAGVVTVIHRDPAPLEALMPDGTRLQVGFWLPGWVYATSGLLLLAGALAAAVRLFLLAAPTRAVLDLLLALTLAAAVFGFGGV